MRSSDNYYKHHIIGLSRELGPAYVAIDCLI